MCCMESNQTRIEPAKLAFGGSMRSWCRPAWSLHMGPTATTLYEFFVLNLITVNRECRGVTALCVEDGSVHHFQQAN